MSNLERQMLGTKLPNSLPPLAKTVLPTKPVPIPNQDNIVPSIPLPANINNPVSSNKLSFMPNKFPLSQPTLQSNVNPPLQPISNSLLQPNSNSLLQPALQPNSNSLLQPTLQPNSNSLLQPTLQSNLNVPNRPLLQSNIKPLSPRIQPNINSNLSTALKPLSPLKSLSSQTNSILKPLSPQGQTNMPTRIQPILKPLNPTNNVVPLLSVNRCLDSNEQNVRSVGHCNNDKQIKITIINNGTNNKIITSQMLADLISGSIELRVGETLSFDI